MNVDLKRLISDLQDVQQRIEDGSLFDESELLQNIIDELTIVYNRERNPDCVKQN